MFLGIALVCGLGAAGEYNGCTVYTTQAIIPSEEVCLNLAAEFYENHTVAGLPGEIASMTCVKLDQ